MASDPQEFNPYQAPAVSDLELPIPPELAQARVPWEDPEQFPRFWSRVGETLGLAFRAPTDFIARMPSGDSLGAPWRFVLLLTAPLFLILGALALVLGAIFFAEIVKELRGPSGLPAGVIIALVIGAVALMPLLYFVQILLWGLLNHACLWLWGGLRQGEPVLQTLRATGYALAFLNLGSLIPLVNYIVLILVPVILGMGLARLHRTDTWRGICAALTPIVLCCCLYAGFIALAMALGNGFKT